MDLFNDKIDLIKSHKVGATIKVFLNFRAREYNGKWFNSIGAWKIESDGASTAGGDEDLPF